MTGIENDLSLNQIANPSIAEKFQDGTEIKTSLLKEDDLIIFEFEGVFYLCPANAYYINRILLPDGRVLAAKSWFHDLPRRPAELYVLEVLPLAVRI